MPETVIKIEGLSKQYRYGVIGHGTLYKDLQSWWARLQGKEDPNMRITTDVGSGLDGEWFWALQDISFEVQQGEVLGIIGRNGAGKSTLLKILSRVTTPTKGVAKLKGRVASLLEIGTGFHPELTGRENIFLNGAILGMTKTETSNKLDEIVDFSGLERFLDTPVKRYSSGMYVRLAFAVAAHLEPEILLVDEVLAVGDVEFQKKCIGKMGDVAKGGRTILFVSHNMSAIRNLCPRTILLDKGEIAIDSTTDKAVTHYLNQNLLEGAVATETEIQERMEGVIRQRNPFVRFKRISLHDKSGECRKSFDSDEDITVSITFECLQPVQNLFILVNIVDENNNPILSTQNVDDPNVTDSCHRLEAGTYTTSCILPANTFGNMPFFISVHLICPKTEHLIVNKILEFEVKFKGYNNMYLGGKGAFIRPQIPWVMQAGHKQELGSYDR